jgi:hypothetical protein
VTDTPPPMPKLSAYILAFNEAEKIKAAIVSVFGSLLTFLVRGSKKDRDSFIHIAKWHRGLG